MGRNWTSGKLLRGGDIICRFHSMLEEPGVKPTEPFINFKSWELAKAICFVAISEEEKSSNTGRWGGKKDVQSPGSL